MSWFGNSKKNQKLAEEAALKAQEELTSLQEEIQRLQTALAESQRLQADWQASTEVAKQERDALRNVSERALAHERQIAANLQTQFEKQRQELESSLAAAVQKQQLVDTANGELAETIKSNERRFEELQAASARERSERDETVRQRDQELSVLQSELAGLQTQLTRQSEQAATEVAELKRQLTEAEHQATVKNVAWEQRLKTEADQAAARIEQLEQQLTQSELKSANRAEQRSALLRNLAEIHRLSATASKAEPTPDSLKVVSPEWSGTAQAPTEAADESADQANSFLSRSGT